MQIRSFISSYNVFVSFGILILTRKNLGACNPIANSNFNEQIREFSLKENNTNITEVKTLQKEDPKRYTDLTPFRPIHLKDIPDNKLSSSSHGWSSQSSSRGLISRDHPGYYIHDYEEYPPVGYGYEYQVPISDHNMYEHHNIDHYHYGHHGGGHHYTGSHYKHYNHALAAKAVLWPIAGIALLGAAAALVSNPILLQLGVASGKRRRRDTEEVTGPDLDMDYTKFNSQEENIHKNPKKIVERTTSRFQRKALINKGLNLKLLSKNYNPPPQSSGDFKFIAPLSSESDDDNLVPVPIKFKHE